MAVRRRQATSRIKVPVGAARVLPALLVFKAAEQVMAATADMFLNLPDLAQIQLTAQPEQEDIMPAAEEAEHIRMVPVPDMVPAA